jgi:hypothetical protein
MKIKCAISLFEVLVITGCLSTEELRKQDTQKCTGYGFRLGTPQFAQCMMKMERERDKAQECLGASLGAYSSAAQGQAAGDMSRARADCYAGRPIRPPAPAPATSAPITPPRNTTCTPSGNSINCITY